MTRTVAFPHKDVQQLANVDYQNTLAIVGIVPSVAGDEIVVAIGEYFLEPRQGEAEVAFVVQDEWQQKGMGTLLLKFLSEVARKRDVKSFHAKVLPQNKAMLAVFHNSGYNIKTEFDGEVYDITYDLEPKKS
jgi:GNAT superfamily N-acetyltransferase